MLVIISLTISLIEVANIAVCSISSHNTFIITAFTAVIQFLIVKILVRKTNIKFTPNKVQICVILAEFLSLPEIKEKISFTIRLVQLILIILSSYITYSKITFLQDIQKMLIIRNE
uniref:Transmembrane domain-containing protein n=1 Tax=Spironucleus salmonicida TaxID=348837 RepID=V6LMG5_9EUKA|eukprot:EST41909.1 Transmembrane domain-containing protein [Spironucleus salmonicida]